MATAEMEPHCYAWSRGFFDESLGGAATPSTRGAAAQPANEGVEEVLTTGVLAERPTALAQRPTAPNCPAMPIVQPGVRRPPSQPPARAALPRFATASSRSGDARDSTATPGQQQREGQRAKNEELGKALMELTAELRRANIIGAEPLRELTGADIPQRRSSAD
mmetsp:Transcript_42040/g.121461  ORF Transcript_42040/g.121461 Transcript_42040/m.121461 type:complete len:164 (+) Transcript_42040:45-536(+)